MAFEILSHNNNGYLVRESSQSGGADKIMCVSDKHINEFVKDAKLRDQPAVDCFQSSKDKNANI